MTTTTTTKRYGLRYAFNYYVSGRLVPVDPEADTHWLDRNAHVDKRNGWLMWKVTPSVDLARSWATPEGAAGYLAKHLTFDDGSQFVVDVLPL